MGKLKRVVFDIEANELLYLAHTIWCIVAKDIDTGEILKFTPDTIEEGIQYLQSCDVLIGHNICGYDVPLIQKLYGVEIDIKKCRDTLVMSKLFFTDKLSHSLESYGKKFKRYKPEHKDWSTFSKEMLHRCTEDVEINCILYEYLLEKEIKKWDWSSALFLEQYFEYDQAIQELSGVSVDVELAHQVIEKIDKEVEELDRVLHESIPPRVIDKKPVNRPFLKNGDYSAMSCDWFCEMDDRTILTVEGPFSRISYEPINLNSYDQVKKYLLSVGWVPTTWNYKKDDKGFFEKDAKGKKIKTSPKLTEDSFDSIKDGTGQLVARRNVIVHRRRTISNYKDPENKGILSFIRDDGRVPAKGFLNSAITGRTKHTEAVCNIPKAKKKIPYGIEMRSIFCVNEEGYSMLGADLDQIEARITAHYASIFDGGDYWRIIQETGDIHQHNADMLGVERDPTAKAFQYAVFYGARAPKVASIVGCSVKKAQDYLDIFWSGTRGVYDLIQALEDYFDKYGFIKGLDGRKLKVRAKYKLLNTLIQSAAAIVFKKWGNVANRRLKAAGLDCVQIIAYHDEYEYRCKDDDIGEAMKIIKEAATDAGKILKLYTPITVDVKCGKNWAEVH